MAAPDTPTPEACECVGFANFVVDVAGHTLTGGDGRDVRLTRAEYTLLLAFLRAPGRVLSRDHLLDAVAGRQSTPFDRSIDVLVSRLRRKIEPDPSSPRLILTVPGVGYRFAEHPRAVPTPLEPRARELSIVVLPFTNLSDDPERGAGLATAGQTRLSEHTLDDVVVHADLAGDGADAPFFHVVVAQDLRLALARDDHDQAP